MEKQTVDIESDAEGISWFSTSSSSEVTGCVSVALLSWASSQVTRLHPTMLSS